MDSMTKLLDDAMNANFVKANYTLNNVLGPRESMYLGCLWNHYKYLLYNKSISDEDFFFMSKSVIVDRTGITLRVQDTTVLPRLIELNIIKTFYNRKEHNKYFKFNRPELFKYFPAKTENVAEDTLTVPSGPWANKKLIHLSQTDFDNAKSVLHVWNSIKQVSKHGMPEEASTEVSKTIKLLSDYLRHLQKGDFVSKYEAQVGIGKEIREAPLSLLQIKKCVKSYASCFYVDYLPTDKSKLPTKLTDFFCSFKTHYSTFYHILQEGVHNRAEAAGVDKLNLKQAIFDKFNRKIQGGAITDYVTKDVESMLFKCEKEHRSFTASLDGIYEGNTNYIKQIQNFSFFMNNFYVFFEKAYGTLPMEITKLWFNKEKSKTFQKFIAWIRQQYGIVLYPTDIEVQAIEARRDMALGKAEEPSIEDLLTF